MRIGIMTFWESQNNYGQIVQAFALKTYLQRNGHEVFFIKYHRVIDKSILYRLTNFKMKEFISRRITSMSKKKSVVEPSRDFDIFKKKYLSFTENSYFSLKDLQRNPPEADVYISGSDQVWNNSFNPSCEAFLLGFGDTKVRRLSYAASFGSNSIDKKTKKLFQNNIGRFNGVSVREKSGLEICNDVGFNNAIWVPDPTLLFNKDEWLQNLSIRRNSSLPENKRVFIYTVGDHMKDKQKVMEYVHGLPGVSISHATANDGSPGNSFPAVEDWVRSISEANFVVTNSFHGTVFCIIFNKNFVVLPNTGVSASLRERITSLLDKVDLRENILEQFSATALENLINKSVDWEKIASILDSWKDDARVFLSESLSENIRVAEPA